MLCTRCRESSASERTASRKKRSQGSQAPSVLTPLSSAKYSSRPGFEERAHIDNWLGNRPRGHELQWDDEPAEATVSVFKGVNRFELVMCDPGSNKRRVRPTSTHELQQVIHCWRNLLGGRWYKSGCRRRVTRRTEDDLLNSELARAIAFTPRSTQKCCVKTPDQADAQLAAF